MTRAELRAELESWGFPVNQAQQDRYIDQAIRNVWSQRRWDFKEATATTTATIGTPNYALSAFAADIATVDGVRWELGTDSNDLVFLPTQRFRDQEQIDRTNDLPAFWSKFAGEIRIYPRPDQAYTLRIDYLKVSPTIADGAQLPGLDEFHDVYLFDVLRHQGARIGGWELVTWAEGQRKERLQAMIAAHGIQQRQSSRGVRKSGYFDDNTELY